MMASIRRRRMAVITLLVSFLAVNGVVSLRNDRRNAVADYSDEPCPPCELLFSKLERTGRDGKLAQDVRVQERGEPKSGTGFMYFWASAAMMHACDYLQGLFGEGSCRIDFTRAEENDDEVLARYSNRSMTFEPALGRDDSRCSCDTVDRVSIVVSKVHKHTLPVNSDCAFSHIGGIGFGKGELDEKPKESVCTFADGTPVNNHDDLWRCMHEANCTINDDWLQMAVFRDPRPAVVSTYYHLEVHGGLGNESLDAFVAKELPILCQWVAARYILFSGMLVDQSFEFWYSAANANPLSWHYQWFFAVGLQLPVHVVESTAQAAAADDLGFNHKEIDLHPGEEARAETSVRRFEDEVSPDIVKVADAVLRTWLPPVLLERLGVEP